MQKISNISELRNDLLTTYEALKAGEIDPTKAKEFSNLAGKVINTLKVQISYNEQMGLKTKIDFLEPRL